MEIKYRVAIYYEVEIKRTEDYGIVTSDKNVEKIKTLITEGQTNGKLNDFLTPHNLKDTMLTPIFGSWKLIK